MRRIRLFLCSSITEFAAERMILGDFVRVLNDILVDRGVYIHLEKSEDITNAIDLYRKQNRYNAVIRKSDYFFMLVGRAVGAYTMEEYTKACRSPKSGIRILFCGKGETSAAGTKRDAGLPDAGAVMTPQQFRKLLETENRFYMDAASPDSIKLALLTMLMAEEEIASGMFFRDGQAWLDGRAALSLMETPVYQKEEGLRQAVLRGQELERELARCLQAGDEQSLQRAEHLKEEIREVSELLGAREEQLLELYTYINQNRTPSGRERTAQQYLARGDLPAAIQILQDPLRQSEREAAEDSIQRLRRRAGMQICQNREEAMELLGGDFPEELPEEVPAYAYLVERLLKENAELAREYLTGFQAIGDYARWRLLQGKREEAAQLIREQEAYLQLYGQA